MSNPGIISRHSSQSPNFFPPDLSVLIGFNSSLWRMRVEDVFSFETEFYAVYSYIFIVRSFFTFTPNWCTTIVNDLRFSFFISYWSSSCLRLCSQFFVFYCFLLLLFSLCFLTDFFHVLWTDSWFLNRHWSISLFYLVYFGIKQLYFIQLKTTTLSSYRNQFTKRLLSSWKQCYELHLITRYHCQWSSAKITNACQLRWSSLYEQLSEERFAQ